MSHLPDPTKNLNPEAQKIYNSIISIVPHSPHWPGLFPMLMLYPDLAEKFFNFGKMLRSDGVLPDNYREFTILSLAARYKIAYEWETHQKEAKAAGLSLELIEKIKNNAKNFDDDPFYNVIVVFLDTLLNHAVLPQTLQDQIVAKIGYDGLVQLSFLTGIYYMITMFAKAFEFPLPKGMSDPF